MRSNKELLQYVNENLTYLESLRKDPISKEKIINLDVKYWIFYDLKLFILGKI